MMAPELVDVVTAVQAQIGEQLDLLDREGGAYARACAEKTLRSPKGPAPIAPAGMHPKVREMVRALVSDEMYVRRYYAAESRS